MDLLNTVNPLLTPGQRLLGVKGFDAAEKYPFPRDCQAALFDEEDDYVYIKRTDTNGGVTLDRYRLEPDPIPKFDPKKYVTVDDLAKFKEEVLNAINGLSTSNTGNQYTKQGNSGRTGKQNSGVSEPSGNI